MIGSSARSRALPAANEYTRDVRNQNYVLKWVMTIATFGVGEGRWGTGGTGDGVESGASKVVKVRTCAYGSRRRACL